MTVDELRDKLRDHFNAVGLYYLEKSNIGQRLKSHEVDIVDASEAMEASVDDIPAATLEQTLTLWQRRGDAAFKQHLTAALSEIGTNLSPKSATDFVESLNNRLTSG